MSKLEIVNTTILDGIAALEYIKGKSDKESLQNIEIILDILVHKKQVKWPSAELCKVVYNMKEEDRNVFILLLADMAEGMRGYLS